MNQQYNKQRLLSLFARIGYSFDDDLGRLVGSNIDINIDDNNDDDHHYHHMLCVAVYIYIYEI